MIDDSCSFAEFCSVVITAATIRYSYAESSFQDLFPVWDFFFLLPSTSAEKQRPTELTTKVQPAPHPAESPHTHTHTITYRPNSKTLLCF